MNAYVCIYVSIYKSKCMNISLFLCIYIYVFM